MTYAVSEFMERSKAVLETKTLQLDALALSSFVEHYFNKANQFLGDIDKDQLPLYLLDRPALVKKTVEFRKAFDGRLENTRYYYAMKSNNCPELVSTVISTGFGIDVSSGEELKLALSLGADDIVFSGPGKTEKELELAVLNSERVTVLMDSFGELARIGAISSRLGQIVKTGVRLTTDPRGLWKKFGIMPGDLRWFIKEADKYSTISLQGVQFHTSWNMSPEKQTAFISQLGSILDKLPDDDLKKIQFIDIGGGFWPERGEWLQPQGTPEGLLKKTAGMDTVGEPLHYNVPAASLDRFAGDISSAIKEHIHSRVQCTICFEPGRWICNDAMHILLSVVDKKQDDLVVTDGGTNAVGWERYESDYCPVLNLTRPSMNEKQCLILGSLCTPHDVWGYSYFGETILPGDILMIPCQGAYTYSLRQQFIKPVPLVTDLTLDSGQILT